MQKVVKMTVAVASSLSIAAAGFAGVAGASSLSTTGPDSHNKVVNVSSSDTNVHNQNSVGVGSSNNQGSWTGDAKVFHNTTAGDATSGAAHNSNGLTANLTVDNTGSGCGCAGAGAGGAGSMDGSIDTTGPDSYNKIVNKVSNTVDINNTNNVSVNSTNNQQAGSGDAKVFDNTTGGSATSGDATNSNTSSVTLTVTN